MTKKNSKKTHKHSLKQTPLNQKLFYSLALTLFLAAIGLITFWSLSSVTKFNGSTFGLGLVVGLTAQIVDGVLGMAYGVTATTFLLSTGIPPVLATSSVHISEIFTTGASGLSHWKMGNINKHLFRRLIIPGIIGGVSGVLLITNIDGKIIRPWVSGYLLIIGCYIFTKAFRKIVFTTKISSKKIAPLALLGGFMDSIGGGGWGPIVTTTLLSSGHEPKRAIGSVNAAEFFITIVTGFSFALLIGVVQFEIIAGMIVGGIFAAPIAAATVSRLPSKFLMIMVGILIVALSAFNIYKSF